MEKTPKTHKPEAVESKRHDLFERLDQHQDSMERLKWEGTFEEYVDMVVESPRLAKTSHNTVYQALSSTEDFFKTGRNSLYGAEATTDRYLEVLRAGSEGLELGKRIILFVGPPGSGKSTLVNGTKRGIEAYSKTDEGALYGIKGCPMNEDPLHLVPLDMRQMLADDYDIHVDGELCPDCDFKYGGASFGSDALREVPIERIFLSEKKRVGIGTFKPSDPKSQDIAELIGRIDYSKVGEYGSQSDPRAYRFDGELNVANRGVMEFVEMLKSDEQFLYALLDLAQDRVVKVGGFANISADEVILAHTNLAEYNRYVKDPRNEAIRDRMVVIPVPYALRVDDERKIHEKLIGESEKVRNSSVHVSPHALNTAAMFAVMSRLKDTPKYSKLQKMKIYNGEDIDDLTGRDIREIQASSPDEGMTGISPRFIIDSLSMALMNIKDDQKCLTQFDTLRALQDNIEMHAHTREMKKEDKDALKDDIAKAREAYDEKAKKEVQAAFIYSYEDSARSLCSNYLANVEAFVSKEKVYDSETGEEYEPDEALMRSIEEQIKISDSGKREFRNELMIRMASVLRRGETFDYNSHPRLREAIEQKLFADMKDIVKLTTSSKVPNEEQQKRLLDVQRQLIDHNGYCEHCASELIRRAGTLLNRT